MRYTWIDYAKLFSICLVISYHTPPRIDGYAGEVVQMLRMPAFFLIAGYLFRAEKYSSLKAFIKHRSKGLLTPYLSFFVIFYLLWLCIGRQMIGGAECEIPLYRPLVEFVWGSPSVVVATYWFICCLFSIQVIHYLLARSLPTRVLVATVLAMPYINCFIELRDLPWQLKAALDYLPFYTLANLMKPRINTLQRKDLPAAAAAMALALACAYFAGQTDEKWLLTTCHTLGGLAAMPLYILMCKAIERMHPIDGIAEFIGRNTIIILALQNYIIGFIILIAQKTATVHLIESSSLANIIITMAVLALSILPIQWINRYIPFIVGRGS